MKTSSAIRVLNGNTRAVNIYIYIYKQNTYTQSGAENSLFQFFEILSDVFSVLSRGHEKLLKYCNFTQRLVSQLCEFASRKLNTN